MCSQSAVDAKAMSAARECQRRKVLPGGRKERMNLGYAKRLYLPPPTLAIFGYCRGSGGGLKVDTWLILPEWWASPEG